jgi:hypothetical protein
MTMTVYLKLSGTHLLQKRNDKLANPLHAASQALKELTSIRKKTLDTHRKIARLEFDSSIYCDDDTVGPYIPLHALRATLIAGAKLSRGGREVSRAAVVSIVDPTLRFTRGVPLQCDGARTIGERWEDSEYDQRIVRVGTSGTLRTRPSFQGWSCVVAVDFDPDRIKKNDLLNWMRDAGKYEGLLEGRGLGYGRFDVEELTKAKALKETRAAVA